MIELTSELAREDIEAIRHFASEPCECPDAVKRIADEAPKLLFAPCKCRRWINEGVKLAEELS